jgi:hypothetical protein
MGRINCPRPSVETTRGTPEREADSIISWSAVYSGSSGVETTYFIGDLLEKVSGVGRSFDYCHYIYAGGTKVAA